MVTSNAEVCVKRISGAALAAIAAASLSSCTVGSTGPCNGCIDSTSVAAGAISSAAIQNGAVTSAVIADGAVGTPQLAAGAVTAANIAAGSVGSAALAANAVTGASIDPTTTITAAQYSLSTPAVRIALADPTLCQRVAGGSSNIAPFQDLVVMHPAPTSGSAIGPGGNTSGPSLLISNSSANKYEVYCPVPLNVPFGGTIKVVSASIAYTDTSAQCLIGASLNMKDWSSTNAGTIISSVFNGSSSSDYAFVGAGTKPFPTFTAVTVTAVSNVFVTALIDITSTVLSPPADCRYGGVAVVYTVDRL
jgi:hypothetical protein